MVRGMMILTSGAAASQLIVLAASPVVTRLYPPEQFGVLAVYTGTLGIITVVASLRYQLAIPLPATDGSAANLLALSLVITAIVTLLTGSLVALFGADLVAWANAPELAPYLWLLPVGVFLAGSYQIFSYWAVRKSAFGPLARTKLQQNTGMVAAQIGLGMFHIGPLGLLLGQIVGQAAGLFRLARLALSGNRDDLSRIRAARMIQRARRYRRFPLYLSAAGLLNTTGSQLPLILYSSMFSPAVAGLFLIAYRIVTRPMSLVSDSVRDVFFAGAAQARRDGSLGGLTLRAFRGLVRVGVAPTVLLALAAPELFAVVFGERWTEAGRYVQWMIPWLLASFIVSPLTILNAILERQRAGLLFQIALLAAKLGGLFVGARWFGSPIAAIALYSLGACAVYTAFGLWIVAAAGSAPKDLCRTLLIEAALVLPPAAILLAIKPGSAINEAIGMPGLAQPLWIALVVGATCAFALYRSIPVLYGRRAATT